MCGTCGCSKPETDLARSAPPHSPHADSAEAEASITIEERILARNDAIAESNRQWLVRRGIVALNLMSSPGAGKTTLLERTVREYRGPLPIRVVEGDQATSHDAERVRGAGGTAVQINTGSTCHLNADMVRPVIEAQQEPALLLIENVGNLVCPSLFDLGESRKVVFASVTEGDDKPIKYPHMHRVADLVVLNKIDLLAHVDFSRQRFRGFLAQVNPGAEVIELSARTGQGLAGWYAWLTAASATARMADHGQE